MGEKGDKMEYKRLQRDFDYLAEDWERLHRRVYDQGKKVDWMEMMLVRQKRSIEHLEGEKKEREDEFRGKLEQSDKEKQETQEKLDAKTAEMEELTKKLAEVELENLELKKCAVKDKNENGLALKRIGYLKKGFQIAVKHALKHESSGPSEHVDVKSSSGSAIKTSPDPVPGPSAAPKRKRGRPAKPKSVPKVIATRARRYLK